MSPGQAAEGDVAHVVDEVAHLVAIRARGRLDTVTSVHLTGLLESGGGSWAVPERQRLVEALSVTAPTAFVRGVAVHEPVGVERRLAWFPRPIGPHHAVNVHSPAVTPLAVEVPGGLVRAHLAVATWRAELLQAMTNLAGTSWGARRLDRWVQRGRPAPAADGRWACVVEVVDEASHLVRAWAHGVDRSGVAARLTRHLPAATLDHDGAAIVLDDLAGATGLRWSVGSPTELGQ